MEKTGRKRIESEATSDQLLSLVAVTGGVATGKSTVCRMFANFGWQVLDMDTLAHQVTDRGTDAWTAIRREFGDTVLSTDGSIDRGILRKIVVNDHSRLNLLNRIVHPSVVDYLQQILFKIQHTQPKDPVLLDIPILLEVNMRSFYYRVVLVTAPPVLQIKRLVETRGMSIEEANSWVDMQIPVSRKSAAVDYCIRNDGKPAETRRRVQKLNARLREDWQELRASVSDST